MMHRVAGDMFRNGSRPNYAGVDVMVNPVNCEGVSGAGVALLFKRRYPAMFKEYQHRCRNGELEAGKLYVYATGEFYPSHIICFPTKVAWRENSKVEYIEKGLAALRPLLDATSPTCLQLPDVLLAKVAGPVRSIALPALGSGLGALNYTSQVLPLLEAFALSLGDFTTFLYAPL